LARATRCDWLRDHRSGCRPAPAHPAVPPAALAPGANPWAYGCPGYPAAPAPSVLEPANARPLGAIAHPTEEPTVWVPAASRTSRRANPPARSRPPSRCCRAPRPGADHDAPSETTPASGSGVVRSRPHLASTGRLWAAAAAARAGLPGLRPAAGDLAPVRP